MERDSVRGKDNRKGVLCELAHANPGVSDGLLKLCERALSVGRVSRETPAVSLSLSLSLPGGSPPPQPVGDGRRRERNRLLWINIAIAALLVALIAPAIPSSLVVELTDPLRMAAAAILVVALLALGASIAAALRSTGREPLRAVRPPDAESEQPLSEIRCLALRAAARLRSSYHAQLVIAIGIIVLLAAIVVWSILMVTARQIPYATVLGVGGVGTTALMARWQPFDRVARARDLAEQADVLATGLRLRLATIKEIADPVARGEAEWNAVKDYTQEALGARQATASAALLDCA